jgi:hypothetical protein
MQRAKSLLRRLASAVADVVDESVSEPARVLRLPSGFNFKKQYPEPRPVRLMIDDEPPRYTIAEIEAVIPAEKTTSERESFQVPKTVKSGDRHEILYKFLRSQKARGISLEVALVGCFKLNEDQCKPPIPKDELETYLRRVWEQGDSVAFKTENEKRDFIRDRNGTIIKDCQENIERACERLEYSFSHDLFADRLLVKNGKFDATLLTDQHFTALWLKIDREFRFRPSYQFYERVIYNITLRERVSPRCANTSTRSNGMASTVLKAGCILPHKRLMRVQTAERVRATCSAYRNCSSSHPCAAFVSPARSTTRWWCWNPRRVSVSPQPCARCVPRRSTSRTTSH